MATGATDGDDVAYRSLATDPRLLSLTLISGVGTFGANAVSPALPSMAAALGVSDARIGLVMTLFTLPQIGLILVIGMLADTYGRRVVLLPSLAVFGVVGAAIATVGDLGSILALRALQGVVAGGIVPITITIVGDLYEGATGSTAQGIRLGANGLASIVIPAVAGFLAGIAWYFPFYLFALAVPAAAIGYVYLPETAAGRRGPGLRAELAGYVRALRAEVSNADTGVLVAGGFFQGIVWFVLLTYVPLFAVRSLDATPFAAGAALSMRGVARVFIAPLAGVVLTYQSRRGAMLGALVVLIAGAALVPFVPGVLALGALLLLYGVGDAVFTPVHRDTLTDRASAERRAGVVNGMVVLRQIGATLAPVGFGLVLAVWGFVPVFLLAAATFAAYAALLFVFLDRE